MYKFQGKEYNLKGSIGQCFSPFTSPNMKGEVHQGRISLEHTFVFIKTIYGPV